MAVFLPKLYSLAQKGIRREQLITDILSGIVVGIVALPLAIAFAVASGVSPEKGLITAIVAGFLISALGGSRVQIGGPTGAFIVVVFAIVTQYGLDGLIISTVLAGLMLIAFGLLRLGALLRYFPHPLIVGFTTGIAVVIFSTQIKDALGLTIETLPPDFLGKWGAYLESWRSINPYAIAITVGTLLISIYFKKITGKIPGSLIALLVMGLLVAVADLPVTTIGTYFGEIPSGFHWSIPHVSWQELPKYFAPALTIALLAGIESLLSAVVADGMIGAKHRSNTELIAQGIANIVTPLVGGIPATGAIARTATNVKNGGRTPVAGIVHALTLLLIMLFLGKWASRIPMAVLAGILIHVAYNMSEWRSFLSILKGSRFDIIILLSTFLLTVFVDLTIAIQVGVVLSALLFMKRMTDLADKRLGEKADPDVVTDTHSIPSGIEVFEISGPLFFASARRYTEVMQEIGIRNRVLIIRMRHVTFIDQTGYHNLHDTLLTLSKKGIHVLLSGVHPDLLKELHLHGITALLDDTHIFDNFNDCLSHAKELLVNLEEPVQH